MFCHCLPLAGQNRKTDSLRARLEELPPDTERVRTLLNLGGRVFHSDYKEALDYYREAQRIADSVQFTVAFPDIQISKAELYQYLGANAIAMELALDAFETYKERRDTAGMARSCIALGLLNGDMRAYDKAEQRLKEAERYYAAVGGQRGVTIARHNFAVLLVQTGDTLRADSLYRANLKLLLGTKNNDIIAATYNNLGNNFQGPNDADSSLRYYELALVYKRLAGKNGPTANTFINISQTQLRAGRLAESQAALDSARWYLTSVGSLELYRDLHEQQAKIHVARGRHAEAVTELQEVVRLQDSIFSEDQLNATQQLNAVFESKEKENQIALLNQKAITEEAQSARLWWFNIALAAALALAVVLLTLGFIRGRERRRTFAMLRRKNEEIQAHQQEILLQNEQLAAQNQRLEVLNREKDGLIGIVAHDLRAPLNRSTALAELIASSGPVTPEQERFLKMLRKVNDDGGRLIQDLLEMNSYENDSFRVERHRVNLGEVLERSVRGFDNVAQGKSIGLHLALPDSPVEVLTDDKLLCRVVDNLVSNALKFTQPGRNVYVGVARQNGKAQVFVRDEGQGISADDQKKMFQKFQRLSARPTGGESSTGLGLSIVKTLVDRLGGQIDLESQVGKGTEFRIKIPVA